MRRVWAAVISVWATLAIAAGIAWTRQPAAPAPPATTPAAVVVNGSTPGTRVLTVPASAPATHATTRTS